MVFNKEGRLIAAQWSADTRVWIEIGEVTGNGDGGNINGVQYDHVMPVELDGPGGTTMKLQLGYNNMENPYDAAQRFIDQNSLPQYHLRQIADWIVSRAGQQTPSLGHTSSTSGATSSAATVRSYEHIPVKACLIHDEIPSGFKGKIIPKINEFNGPYTGTQASLSEAEVGLISDLIGVLEETSYYHSSTITPAQLSPIHKIALLWNPTHSFPAFDILRMTALHSSGSRVVAQSPQFAQVIERAVGIISDSAAPAATVLCALRFLGNAFRYEDLKRALLVSGQSKMGVLLEALQSLLYTKKSSNKSIRIAASILVLNVSISLNLSILQSASIHSYLPVATKLISLLSSWLTLETENPDFVYRYIVSIGTIVLINPSHSIDLSAACAGSETKSVLARLSSGGSSELIKKSAAEVLSLL